jgi:hypothetical protein
MTVLDHLKVVSALCRVWPQEPKAIVGIWISRPKSQPSSTKMGTAAREAVSDCTGAQRSTIGFDLKPGTDVDPMCSTSSPGSACPFPYTDVPPLNGQFGHRGRRPFLTHRRACPISGLGSASFVCCFCFQVSRRRQLSKRIPDRPQQLLLARPPALHPAHRLKAERQSRCEIGGDVMGGIQDSRNVLSAPISLSTELSRLCDHLLAGPRRYERQPRNRTRSAVSRIRRHPDWDGRAAPLDSSQWPRRKPARY